MKKGLVVWVIFISAVFSCGAALAEDSAVSAAILNKLDQVLQKQQEIFQQLEEVKSELQIVKVRVTLHA